MTPPTTPSPERTPWVLVIGEGPFPYGGRVGYNVGL